MILIFTQQSGHLIFYKFVKSFHLFFIYDITTIVLF